MRKINVNNNNGSCLLLFTYNKKRYSITHGQFDDPIMYAFMSKLAYEIYLDCEMGNFDPTLRKYKTWEKPTEEIIEVNKLIDLWKLWIKSKQLSDETFANRYKPIQKTIEKGSYGLNETSWLNSFDWAPSTYNMRLSYLRSCFEWGISKGYVTENPYVAIKNKKKINIRVDPFSKEEVQLILNAIANDTYCKRTRAHKHSYYLPFFQFLFATGLRPCEVIGLRWGSVDYERGFIHVKEAISRSKVVGSPSRRRKGTKTGNEWYIPLSDTLKAVLEARRQQSGSEPKSDELVFRTPRGCVINWETISSKLWRPLMKGLGIKYRNPYQIRHTTLSNAVMNPQIGVLGAAKLAGHTNSGMVVKHYGHFIGVPDLPDIL